jgi:hypothetical protein
MSWLASLAVAAITASVIGGTLAFAGDGDRPGTTGETAALGRETVAHAAPQLPQIVAAFRRTPTPDDQLPGGDGSEALDQIGGAPGENPTLARRLQPRGAPAAYVWPMSNGVCYSWGGSGACAQTADLVREGVLLAYGYTSRTAQPQWDLFGLVRDGIGSVEITLQDGSELTAQVQDNAIRTILVSAPVEARWTKPDGTPGGLKFPRRY